MESETMGAVFWLVVALCPIAGAFLGGWLTNVAKRTILARLEERSRFEGELIYDKADAPWWMPLLAAISVAVGTGVGAAIGVVGWHWLYGAVLGAVGGAQPVWIVKLVKAKAKAMDIELPFGDPE